MDDATNQFVPASTRVSYQVICDSAVQDESFVDCVNNSAIACARLGGKQNPCDHMGSKDDDFFEIVVCDNDNCVSLEIGGEEGGVVSYDFAIDPLQTQNHLECKVRLLNNSMLEENNILRGDFPLYNDYIGQNGPNDSQTELGEAIPDVNTCTGLTEVKPMYVIQSKMPEANTTEAFKNATIYEVGCDKRLKIRVKQGYSGSVVLAIQAISTSTSTSTSTLRLRAMSPSVRASSL